VLDSYGKLWCVDAQANNSTSLTLPPSLVNAPHITGVSGDCSLDGRYDVILVTDGLGSWQFVEVKQTAVIMPPPAMNPAAIASPLSPAFPGGSGMTSDGTITFSGDELQQRTGPTTSVQSLGHRYRCGAPANGPPTAYTAYEGG
jgi:hypothetical protein